MTKFAPKYLFEGESVNILQQEMKTKYRAEDIEKDIEECVRKHKKASKTKKYLTCAGEQLI